MKVVILAGGFGTRITEESQYRPKPMLEIGDYPILWHVMKIYSYYGYNDFIVLLGYKGYVIKEYFTNYFLHNSDLTIDLSSNTVEINKSKTEPWKITLVDTGIGTLTGGRIKKAQDYIGNETFMLTYGDGVGNINIPELVNHHKEHKKLATITAVQPAGRFGSLSLDNNSDVIKFQEKPKSDDAWINGGFFVFEPDIFDYIEGDVLLEKQPMERLTVDNQLAAYRHYGFWKPMDTLRDKQELENLWSSDKAEWKIWKE